MENESAVASIALCQGGQRVRRDGFQEMWQFVCVYAKEDENGDLVIRVLVFHPDWEEPLQIATINPDRRMEIVRRLSNTI
jgi:hypothetical protein